MESGLKVQVTNIDWETDDEEFPQQGPCIAEDCEEIRHAPYLLCPHHLNTRNPDAYSSTFIGS